MDYDPMNTLFGALRTDDRLIQAEAARLLGELRSPLAVEPLVAYVRNARWHAKTAGFHALAQIGERSVCDAIRPLVDNPNSSDDWYWYGCRSVRAAAAVALLALGDDSGRGYLEGLAEKNDDVFYAWFAPALLRLPDDLAATAELKARITVERLSGDGARNTRRMSPGIVTMVAEALGVLGGEAACAELVGLLEFRSRYTRGQAAASLLGAAATPEHVAAVSSMARDDPTDFARTQAALALARAGRMEFADQIRAIVRECEDSFDRAVAVQALGALEQHGDLDLVAGQLEGEDPYVRQCAVEALQRIGTERAEHIVRPCRDDPHVRVRMQTAAFYAVLEGAGSEHPE
jgi:HEAT repeat protein